MGPVVLSDLFGDISVASPVAKPVSEFTVDNLRSISADDTGNKSSDKT